MTTLFDYPLSLAPIPDPTPINVQPTGGLQFFPDYILLGLPGSGKTEGFLTVAQLIRNRADETALVLTPRQLKRTLNILNLLLRQETLGAQGWGWLAIQHEAAQPSRKQRAISAVTDLQKWLDLSQAAVAKLTGFSPRSLKNWREETDPYPSSVRKLFEVHSLLTSLQEELGTDRMRAWLAGPSSKGSPRIVVLHEEDGVVSLVREAHEVLFPGSVRERQPSWQLPDHEEPEIAAKNTPDLFGEPVRRDREVH
jgi:hypothetical protein